MPAATKARLCATWWGLTALAQRPANRSFVIGHDSKYTMVCWMPISRPCKGLYLCLGVVERVTKSSLPPLEQTPWAYKRSGNGSRLVACRSKP